MPGKGADGAAAGAWGFRAARPVYCAAMNDGEPHLLVVDDDSRLRELLRRYLADQGFRVTTAGDAAEARAKVASIAFDLLGHRRQQQDRDAALRAHAAREAQPVLAGHHDVEDEEIERDAGDLGARLGGIAGGGDAEALVGEIAAQQLAQPRIVVDHQEMRLAVIHGGPQYMPRAAGARRG